jgi:alginate lyase
MPNYQHCGLYFSAEQVQRARNNRDREPFKTAWAFFDQANSSGDDVLWSALHYRLNNQKIAGEESVTALQNGFGMDAGQTRYEQLASTVMLAHTFELVRDHPAFDRQAVWQARFTQRVDDLVRAVAPDSEAVNDLTGGESLVAVIWLGLLHVAAGVVLGDDAHFEAGAAIYRQIIEHHIRPQGYLPAAVEGADGGSLERQLLAVSGLALTAEAAAQVGIDLWHYASRGISVVTAASYNVYYYYYPDQWPWDTVNADQSKWLYKANSPVFEMVNAWAPLKDVKLLLDELRPLYNPLSGGLTTLTHAFLAKRGLFG